MNWNMILNIDLIKKLWKIVSTIYKLLIDLYIIQYFCIEQNFIDYIFGL